MSTVQEIHTAADVLVSAGDKPTLTALRKVLGGGSFTTISEAMKSWSGRVKAPLETGPDDTPEVVKTTANLLWTEAKKLASKELESARIEMQEFKNELETQTREAFALLESTTAQLEASTVEKYAQTAKLSTLNAELATVQTASVVANATLDEVRRNVMQLQQSLDIARAEAQEERVLARMASELAAELRGRLVSFETAQANDRSGNEMDVSSHK